MPDANQYAFNKTELNENANDLKELYLECPLCGSKQLDDLYLVNRYTITKCPACSLVFVRNILSGKFLSKFYQSISIESNNDHRVYSEAENKNNLRFAYRQLAKKLEPMLPESGRILDIGCSEGHFFDFFPKWERYGVEISERDGTIARQRCNNIFIGDMEEYEMPDGYFDCITMQDSFDHMRNPVEIAQKCRRMLKDKGKIVIKVHNISCVLARITGSKFYAISPPGHLFYYNLGSLRTLFEKTGFVFKTYFYNTHWLQIKTAALRLTQGKNEGLFYSMYSVVKGSKIGNLSVPKNFHDIITVVGEKAN